MKFDKVCLMGLIAGVAMLGAPSVSAVPPPPPHGVVLAPNMVWCSRCGGWGRVPSGLFGWKDKRCPECKGVGMVHPVWYRPPAPVVVPPPPPPHHHHKDVRPVPPPPPKKGGHHGHGAR